MGSKLITKKIVDSGDYETLKHNVSEALRIIASVRK
jgi:hypothetical protein